MHNKEKCQPVLYIWESGWQQGTCKSRYRVRHCALNGKNLVKHCRCVSWCHQGCSTIITLTFWIAPGIPSRKSRGAFCGEHSPKDRWWMEKTSPSCPFNLPYLPFVVAPAFFAAPMTWQKHPSIDLCPPKSIFWGKARGQHRYIKWLGSNHYPKTYHSSFQHHYHYPQKLDWSHHLRDHECRSKCNQWESWLTFQLGDWEEAGTNCAKGKKILLPLQSRPPSYPNDHLLRFLRLYIRSFRGRPS